MKFREHNEGSKIHLQKFLEKEILRYLIENPKAYIIFNEFTGRLLIFDRLTLDKRALEAVYRLQKRGCFKEDERGLSRLSAIGEVEYDDVKDLKWDYPIPRVQEKDLELLPQIGYEWKTCSGHFGYYHYKWWNSLRILTANGFLECKYGEKILRGNKVYQPPKISLRKNRKPEFFRKIISSEI